MKVLLIGHGCAPNMGSEPGNTWNWARHLADHAEVWVITHVYWKAFIEDYLDTHPLSRLHFIYTERLGWWDPLRLPSGRFIQLHYLFWQQRVLRMATEFDAIVDFDLVHHVGWGTVSAPSPIWKLGKPFIWGPVGGGQTAPVAMLRSFGKELPAEILRSMRVKLLPFLPSLRRSIANAAAIFAANRETVATLQRAGARSVPLFADVGVRRDMVEHPRAERPTSGPMTVLWVGSLEPNKGVGLALEIARRVGMPDIKFVIVGEGLQARAVRWRADRMNLDAKVEFRGWLPWQEVQDLFRSAHLYLFTSMRDTFGTTVLEALAGGAPVVCLDHQGVGTHLPADVAVKIPVGKEDVVAAAMAQAIETLARDRKRLALMSHAGRCYAETESWDRRASRMHEQYLSALKRLQPDMREPRYGSLP